MVVHSVTIGKNIGDTPMANKEWRSFKVAIVSLFDQVYFQGESVGEWQGVKEINFKCEGVTSIDLAEPLRILAGLYRQDSIALLVGNSTLIESKYNKVKG